MAVAGKFNIQVGSIGRGVSAEDAGELRARFGELKAVVAELAPQELSQEAAAQAEQLEEAIAGEWPRPTAARRVMRWFDEHAPELSGAVIGVLVDPLVVRRIERAGVGVSSRFHELVEAAGAV